MRKGHVVDVRSYSLPSVRRQTPPGVRTYSFRHVISLTGRCFSSAPTVPGRSATRSAGSLPDLRVGAGRSPPVPSRQLPPIAASASFARGSYGMSSLASESRARSVQVSMRRPTFGLLLSPLSVFRLPIPLASSFRCFSASNLRIRFFFRNLERSSHNAFVAALPGRGLHLQPPFRLREKAPAPLDRIAAPVTHRTWPVSW